MMNCIRNNVYNIRNCSKTANIKYTNTINLPKTKFPQHCNAKKRIEIQEKLCKQYFNGLYEWQRKNIKSNSTAEEFILHDGPPYANGDLHMGHAVNKILKDITIRKNIMDNKRVHYIPGWDCHGLPIEVRVLATQKLKTSLEIRQKARKLALDTIELHKKQFQSWGITADWYNNNNNNQEDHVYKTLDVKYVQNQFKIFYQLYCKGLVYRDLKPVYWSPSSRTALAEAELEYNDKYTSPSLTLRLQMVQIPNVIRAFTNTNTVYAIIWTTTPWTLPSNQAICYNRNFQYSLCTFPDDNDKQSYYIIASALVNELAKNRNQPIAVIMEFMGNELQGSTYLHPTENTNENVLPLIHADHVSSDKGTGLVHTAPAHGFDDYLVCLPLKIELKCFVNELGQYTDDVVPKFLQKKFVLTEGNESILKHIHSNIIHLDKIEHSYPIDWRTKEPVIIRASQQWFINTDKLKTKAIQQLKDVNIYPKLSAESSKMYLINQIEKRPYWCISRQRVWGTPIPVFYKKSTGSVIINEEIIQHLCDLLKTPEDTDLWWIKSAKELLPPEMAVTDDDDIEKGQDILDIWFDSGISWSFALESTSQKIADLYLEGYDQFTGWFQSSLMTSCAVREKAPYKSIFVHGFTVDQTGRKMSKSIGNVISPTEVIEKYGIDTIRWWTAGHGTQNSAITVSPQILQNSAENIQKIRNTLKFIVGFLGSKTNNDDDDLISLDHNRLKMLDKYFLNSLYSYENNISKLYKSYQYNRVTAAILHWIVNDASGIYFHLIKDRLYCGTNQEFTDIQNILKRCYFTLNKTLWPILPFLVEECWNYYDKFEPFYKSAAHHSSSLPAVLDNNNNNNQNDLVQANEIIQKCIEIRNSLHMDNKQNIIPWCIDLEIECNRNLIIELQSVHPSLSSSSSDDDIVAATGNSELCDILQVSNIKLIQNDDCKTWQFRKSSSSSSSTQGEKCPRCRRFKKMTDHALCTRCNQVMTAARGTNT